MTEFDPALPRSVLCLLGIAFLWLEPVLLHHGFSVWRADKSGEGAGGRLVPRAFHDRKALVDRLVQLFRYQRPATIALNTQRQRHNRDFNIASLRILNRLSNVVAVNELGLHSVPHACTHQSRSEERR